MTRRRAVITGVGMVSPLGCGVELSWKRLVEGESGVCAITDFETEDLKCRIGGVVPKGDAPGAFEEGRFYADEWLSKRDQRRMSQFIIYALAAARMALKDSGWSPQSEEERDRSGVIVGSGIGGLEAIHDTTLTLASKGPRRVLPFFVPSSVINLAAGHIAISHGLRGPNRSVVTACATGAHALGDAARMVNYGIADMMVAGGSEACISRLGLAGFTSLKALSTHFNDEPQTASRPWDRKRDGFVMSEGSGLLVVEEYGRARKRGAHIYAEVVGYGESGDAYHITAPAEDGGGAERAIRAALRDAGLAPGDIDYLNAHSTSTPLGDEVELMALRRVFGNEVGRLAISSTKSAVGHMLGAAGSVEAIFSVLAMRDGVAPPTLNLDSPEPICEGLNLVPFEAQSRKIRRVMSNSFGFGGTNASLIFAPPP